MATHEERLNEIEAALRGLPDSAIGSGEEFARRESVRFAQAIGSTAPEFRTTVSLRFSGKGVDGHDLPGIAAGEVLTHFTEAVRAAGSSFKSAGPGAFDLFLS